MVEPYRRRVNGPDAEQLRSRLEAWAEAIEPDITGVFPEMPESIVDRDADVWESLIAVADAAGGDWPNRARVAAVALVAETKGSTPSLGVLLLADVRTVFKDADSLATDTILTRLHSIDESPWGDLRGKPMDARGLSRLLRPYGIRPTTVRIGSSTPKGYRREDMHDSWARYLSVPQQESATTATTDTECPRCAGEECAHCN